MTIHFFLNNYPFKMLPVEAQYLSYPTLLSLFFSRDEMQEIKYLRLCDCSSIFNRALHHWHAQHTGSTAPLSLYRGNASSLQLSHLPLSIIQRDSSHSPTDTHPHTLWPTCAHARTHLSASPQLSLILSQLSRSASLMH